MVRVDDDEVLKRLGGRLSCTCGATYHIKNHPPKTTGVCDQCGGKLFIRDDDKPEVIRERLRVYHRLAEPMVDYFRKSGNLIEVNGEQNIDDVFDELTGQL